MTKLQNHKEVHYITSLPVTHDTYEEKCLGQQTCCPEHVRVTGWDTDGASGQVCDVEWRS